MARVRVRSSSNPYLHSPCMINPWTGGVNDLNALLKEIAPGHARRLFTYVAQGCICPRLDVRVQCEGDDPGTSPRRREVSLHKLLLELRQQSESKSSPSIPVANWSSLSDGIVR